MEKHRILALSFLMVSVILVSACTGSAGPADQSVIEAPSGEGAGPAAPAADEPAAPAADEPAEVEAEPQEIVQPRQELEATDPATVSLASGQPQIVEFFAFW